MELVNRVLVEYEQPFGAFKIEGVRLHFKFIEVCINYKTLKVIRDTKLLNNEQSG